MNKYLIKLADHLDKKGLHKEADYVDWIIKNSFFDFGKPKSDKEEPANAYNVFKKYKEKELDKIVKKLKNHFSNDLVRSNDLEITYFKMSEEGKYAIKISIGFVINRKITRDDVGILKKVDNMLQKSNKSIPYFYDAHIAYNHKQVTGTPLDIRVTFTDLIETEQEQHNQLTQLIRQY